MQFDLLVPIEDRTLALLYLFCWHKDANTHFFSRQKKTTVSYFHSFFSNILLNFFFFILPYNGLFHSGDAVIVFHEASSKVFRSTQAVCNVCRRTCQVIQVSCPGFISLSPSSPTPALLMQWYQWKMFSRQAENPVPRTFIFTTHPSKPSCN